ncbi:unnamed protein product [Linum tenue]|uniref:Uncharacterized protein n=1 Tax=Linum tenue TaxID=586396 RepID=A0AAV0NCR2_9ROSI|nr:unnamed protein product [Linum tenue]
MKHNSARYAGWIIVEGLTYLDSNGIMDCISSTRSGRQNMKSNLKIDIWDVHSFRHAVVESRTPIQGSRLFGESYKATGPCNPVKFGYASNRIRRSHVC